MAQVLPNSIVLIVMKRMIELDVLRGFLLLMMVVNHSPTPLRSITDQPVGFFSTAEPFVFISALLAGLLFQKRREKSGFAAARAATLERALRIYRAHLITLFVVFAIGSLFLAEVPGIRYELNKFFDSPTFAVAGSVALLFQPPLLDILPMYVIFSLLTPLAFWVADRFSWRAVFATSLGVWALSQFNMREFLTAPIRDQAFVQIGPFDLFSWQFLWVTGLMFGRSLQQEKPILRFSRRTEAVLLMITIGFTLSRWTCAYFNVDASGTFWFLDKWHLGPLRLLDFFLVAWFAAKALPYLRRWREYLRPLSAVGQNMLPIFSTEVCLSIFVIGWISVRHHSVDAFATFLLLIQVVIAFVVGLLLEYWKARSEPARSLGAAPSAA
jgi:hypothetical protein